MNSWRKTLNNLKLSRSFGFMFWGQLDPCILTCIHQSFSDLHGVAFDQVEKALKTESCDVSLQKHILTFLERMWWRVFIETPVHSWWHALRATSSLWKTGNLMLPRVALQISTGSGGCSHFSALLKTVDKVKQGRKVIRSNVTIPNTFVQSCMRTRQKSGACLRIGL